MSVTWLQPKDPSEVADYSYSFVESVPQGQTVASRIVALIEAAGATVIQSDVTTAGIVTFRLSGGNHLETALIDISVTLSGGQVLNGAVKVPIIDNASTVTQSIAEMIRAELTAVRAARLAYMTGGAVQQAWSGRYGNRMTYKNPDLKDYNDMIAMLERDLEAALSAEFGGRRRRPIRLLWA